MTYAQPEALTIEESGVYKGNVVSWLTAAATYIGSATYLTDGCCPQWGHVAGGKAKIFFKHVSVNVVN